MIPHFPDGWRSKFLVTGGDVSVWSLVVNATGLPVFSTTWLPRCSMFSMLLVPRLHKQKCVLTSSSLLPSVKWSRTWPCWLHHPQQQMWFEGTMPEVINPRYRGIGLQCPDKLGSYVLCIPQLFICFSYQFNLTLTYSIISDNHYQWIIIECFQNGYSLISN